MTDLAKLADRIERAEGPSRELDAEIALAAGWTERVHGNPSFKVRSCQDPTGKQYQHGLVAWAPRYTASIDAAMTLVPEPAEWTLSVVNDEPCLVTIPAPGTMGDAIHTLAATPALALCAAALRARAQPPVIPSPDKDTQP